MSNAFDDEAKTNTMTACFNVGGMNYEVSLSLLQSFPDTVLATQASNPVQSQPPFLDRDGERFRYCLDFMRDGRVELPTTISRGSLLEDLAFYGFEDIDQSFITTTTVSTFAISSQVKNRSKSMQKELSDIDERIADFDEQKQILNTSRVFKEFAFHCFARCVSKGSETTDTIVFNVQSEDPDSAVSHKTFDLLGYSPHRFKLLNECLACYEIQYVDMYRSHGHIHVTAAYSGSS